MQVCSQFISCFHSFLPSCQSYRLKSLILGPSQLRAPLQVTATGGILGGQPALPKAILRYSPHCKVRITINQGFKKLRKNQPNPTMKSAEARAEHLVLASPGTVTTTVLVSPGSAVSPLYQGMGSMCDARQISWVSRFAISSLTPVANGQAAWLCGVNSLFKVQLALFLHSNSLSC